MEDSESDENGNFVQNLSFLLQSFFSEQNQLRMEDTEQFRSRLADTRGFKMKNNLLREQIESNLPASADLLDRLLGEKQYSTLENIQYLFFRSKVAMSLETVTEAHYYAGRAFFRSLFLYQAMKDGMLNPNILTQSVYNAYFSCCQNSYGIRMHQNRLEEAQLFVDDAKAAAEAYGNADDVIRVKILQADLLMARCQFTKATEGILKPLLKKHLSDENRGLVLQKLGNRCQSAAQWGASKTYLHESISIARRLKDKVSEYDRILDLGNVYRAEGRIAVALEKQACYMAFAFSRGDKLGFLTACEHMSRSYFSMTPYPDYEKGLNFAAVKMIQSASIMIPNERLRDEFLKSLNNVFYCPVDQYETMLSVSMEIVERTKMPEDYENEGQACKIFGPAFRFSEQYDESIMLHRKYKDDASARGDNEIVAIMQSELALDYLLKKDLENAEKEVKKAILTLESIRGGLGEDDASRLAHFEKNQTKAYNLLQAILVQQGKIIEALALSEFARGRAITDIVRENSATKPGDKNAWIWRNDILIKTQFSKDLVNEVIAEFYRIADELDTNFLVYSIVTEYSKCTEGQYWLYVWLVKCSNDLLPGKERITFRRRLIPNQSPEDINFNKEIFTVLSPYCAKMKFVKCGDMSQSQRNQNHDEASGQKHRNEGNDEVEFSQRDNIKKMMELLERLSFRKNTRESGKRRDAAKESTHPIVPERNVKQKGLREGLECQSENDEKLDKEILEGGRIIKKNCMKVATEMERVQDDSVQLSYFYQLYLTSLKDDFQASDYRRMQRMVMGKQHGSASRKQIDISPDLNTSGQGHKKEENIEPMFPGTGRVRKFMDFMFHFLGGEHKKAEYIEPMFSDSGRVRKFMDLLDSLLLEKNIKERKESAIGAKGSTYNSTFLRNDQGKELCEGGNRKAGNVEELTEEEVDDRKECAEVSSEMDRYILVSEKEEDDDEWLRFLYKIYLAPLEDELPTSNEHRVPRITVIPHNFLCSFPFCAFIDPDGRYLVERYVITSIPSLRALCLLQERLSQLRKLQGIRKLKVLAVGNPKMTYSDIPEIPFSGTEAENVRRVFGTEQCQLAVKDKATKELVLNEIKNVDILHLATHACPEEPEEENAAQQGDYIMRGFLMLASSGEDCDGFLNAHEIANATCNCQLVLLSCCETGLGKVTGDGVVGLYRAFLVAGAAGVLVTLWKISDCTTQLFMEKFYSVFKETEDVPLALRNAMLFCLKEKDFPPQEWAAFSLIGASKTRHRERTN